MVRAFVLYAEQPSPDIAAGGPFQVFFADVA
jgi:hypothetical protein